MNFFLSHIFQINDGNMTTIQIIHSLISTTFYPEFPQ